MTNQPTKTYPYLIWSFGGRFMSRHRTAATARKGLDKAGKNSPGCYVVFFDDDAHSAWLDTFDIW